jgi:AraC family transcriptional activator of pobA
MKNLDIPRMELDSFTSVNYTVPLLKVLHYPLNSTYFIIEDRENYPVIDYISPNRRNFFKVFHMTGGTGILTVGLHKYEMGPGSIAFLHPDEIMSWQTTSQETKGHFCLIHPKYFEHDAEHVRQLFKNFPFFKADRAVVQLTNGQSDAINNCFKNILTEERQGNDDKKQAILLHLQMILVETQRAGKNMAVADVPDNYSYIYKFLALLESNFQLEEKGISVKHKNASEFAEQLHVHPNYLNSLVKQQTGKTLRDHIQERILYEAKSLLLQTDWDINNIGYGLGFSGPAAFTSFFKKKENISPSIYRRNAQGERHLSADR